MLETGTRGVSERSAVMSAILSVLDDGSIIRCGSRLVFGKDAEALRNLQVCPVDGRVILDFSETELIDAAGLGALVDLHVKVMQRGAELVLLNPHPNVCEVLSMTRLDSVFTICDLRVEEYRRTAHHAA